jgi:hypothetical protein
MFRSSDRDAIVIKATSDIEGAGADHSLGRIHDCEIKKGYLKGGTNMNLKKTFLVGGLMAALIIATPGLSVFAMEPAPDPEVEKIIGPTMWAVCVINTEGGAATLRVKKIDDCNVDTDPQVATVPVAGLSESTILYYRLTEGVFPSDFESTCTPIITKVKNYKEDGDLVSFDAQIQFVVPNGYTYTECQPPQQ